MAHHNAGRNSRQSVKRMMLIASTALYSGFAFSAAAQTAAPPPENETVDANNVDLFQGKLSIKTAAVTMGQESAGVSYMFMLDPGGAGWTDNFTAYVQTDPLAGITVVVDGASNIFTDTSGTFSPKIADGSTLTLSGDIYTYTSKTGLTAHFNKAYVDSGHFGNRAYATDVRYPSGHLLTYSYDQDSGYSRLSNVSSNMGYRLDLHYYDNRPYGQSGSNWFVKTKVDLINTQSGSSYSLLIGIGQTSVPGATFGTTVTDALGRSTQYVGSVYNITGVAKPGSTTPDITFAYDTEGRITSATDPKGTTAYGYADADGVRTVTVTDPLAHTSTYRFSLTSQLMLSHVDAGGRTTSYQYDGNDRITQITRPEGNQLKYAYDGRGNIVETREVSKTPGTPPDVVTSAAYPTICATAATCNKPIWTKDALGNQTDYSYEPATGNIVSVQLPSAMPNGPRPTTTTSYVDVNGIQMPSVSVTCSVTASCAGSPSETKTTATYNGNALPVMVTTQAGDGSTTASTSMTYDGAGNVTSVDGPLPGTADTVTYRFNADREVVGTISPDPDGSGPLKAQAVRITYDARGRVTLKEVGTVTDASDASWAGFASQQQIATTYDGADRPLTQTLSAGDQSSVKTYAYDHHRLDRETLVMAGSGADRTTKYTYDETDRLIKTTAGFGTPEQADVSTASYTANGQIASMTDGKGNVTSYGYDGLDRLLITTFPGGSYEQVGYDANGNATSRRLRDGQTISYSYDTSNRVVLKTLPNEPAVSFAYDLMGRQISATSSLQSLTFGYDALGRQQTQSGPLGTITSAFDAAGRRTRLTWPNGTYVDYDYNAAGQMTAVRENGSLTLASYGYNELGQRTSITRGNGVTTNLTFDPLSRLHSLEHDLGGTDGDVTTTFTYNKASQITYRTKNNATYQFTDQAVTNRPYTTNALNQYTLAGATAFAYDGRGNLTSSGVVGYAYSVENMLTSTQGLNLSYDPLLRLTQLVGANGTTNFQYDGANLVAEYDASNTMTKRYVFGAAVDEPIVWYEGAGTTDRRWLIPDERGSIVAVTDGSGNRIAVNTYDDFGIPGTTNLGRFQFTGQVWVPEIGLYHYKARTYSPTLGRFLQTDPLGYADGLNLYNYVGNDPVNSTDPSGMLSVDEILVTGRRGGGGGLGFGSVSGALGMVPGATLGSFGPRPEAEPDAEEDEIVVNGVRPKPKAGSGLGRSPVSMRSRKDDVCNSKLQKAAEGLQVGGDAIAYPGIALAAVGAVAVGPAGAGPGLAIAEIGGTAGALGQALEDYNHSRPGLEIAARAFVGVAGGRVAVTGLRALTRVGSKITGEFFDKALGEVGKRTISWIDPDRCP